MPKPACSPNSGPGGPGCVGLRLLRRDLGRWEQELQIATLDKPRHHAMRTRAPLLAELVEQPADRWRLNHVAREAKVAITVAMQANRVLEAQDAKEGVAARNLQALAQVAAELAEGEADSRTA